MLVMFFDLLSVLERHLDPQSSSRQRRIAQAFKSPARAQPRPDELLDSIRNIDMSRYMESKKAIEALAALAQPTRLDVFRLLVRHGADGLPAGEIARALGVPQNTMSSHLSVLSRAGLVSARRLSRSIIYRANLTRFQSVVLFMLKDCCGGRPEICTPLIEGLTPCYQPPKRKRAHAKV